MLKTLGPAELIIILVIVLVIFGAGRLPEIGGALGKGIKEFKEASEELEGASEDVESVMDDETNDKEEA
ncbi:MAG: twin-arginine translocase TatA/TatE family subunit [Anaerolineales bacterium]